MRITPEHITELKPNEIFVFGANLAGRHGAGAAKQAVKWGAVYGQGEGIMGQTYAIPTKDKDIKRLRIDFIHTAVKKFVLFVREHPDLTFMITPIGCGLAGYDPVAIAPMFKQFIHFDNVYLPQVFVDAITKTRREHLDYWNNLKPFTKDMAEKQCIPLPPRCDKALMDNFYAPRLVKAGAIPLKDLVDGGYYFGQCRNADVARWHADKQVFIYWRHKFGDVFEEDINHFEMDNGYDLFVPIMKVTEKEFNESK